MELKLKGEVGESLSLGQVCVDGVEWFSHVGLKGYVNRFCLGNFVICECFCVPMGLERLQWAFPCPLH